MPESLLNAKLHHWKLYYNIVINGSVVLKDCIKNWKSFLYFENWKNP